MHHSLRYDGNKGFSLVEVLVCIAILVIVCIPIFAGFRTSSVFNNRAHHTQAVTTFAQEVVEDMKRKTVDDFTTEIKNAKDKDGINSGDVANSDSDEAKNIITCKQERIEIGGKTYNMEAVYDPTPYSNDSSGIETVADINKLKVSDVNNIDGLKYPVISDELSRYEGTGDSTATFLNDLQRMDEAGRGTKTLHDLYINTKKTIDIVIKDDGSSAIKVIADVTYEIVGTSLKKTYNVYNSRFALQELKDSAGNFVSYSAGGKIYIFARAYQDQSGVMGGGIINNNTIRITNQHAGNPLDVYLVRGYYSGATVANPNPSDKRGVNFDLVALSDGSSEHSYSTLAPSENLTGEFVYANMNFYTNIKGNNLRKVLTAEDMEQTIGKEVSKLRCYQLTVTLTDVENGNVTAHVVSTKEM